jgi:hypothetical protein
MMAVVLFLQLYNAPTGIAAAYLDTMQGLMQKAVHDDHRLTESQVLMLVIEGVVVGGIAVLLVWFCAAQVGYWTTHPSSSIVMYLLNVVKLHASTATILTRVPCPPRAQLMFRRFVVFSTFMLIPLDVVKQRLTQTTDTSTSGHEVLVRTFTLLCHILVQRAVKTFR